MMVEGTVCNGGKYGVWWWKVLNTVMVQRETVVEKTAMCTAVGYTGNDTETQTLYVKLE